MHLTIQSRLDATWHILRSSSQQRVCFEAHFECKNVTEIIQKVLKKSVGLLLKTCRNRKNACIPKRTLTFHPWNGVTHYQLTPIHPSRLKRTFNLPRFPESRGNTHIEFCMQKLKEIDESLSNGDFAAPARQ
jgi:hypothetical protein